jgi:hypothetical protein
MMISKNVSMWEKKLHRLISRQGTFIISQATGAGKQNT